MRFCFISMFCWLLAAGALRGADAGEDYRKATSVVRPDPRTGRLVRTVLVTPREVSGRRRRDTPELRQTVEHAARLHGVDPLLVHAIIEVESGYNQYALSVRGAEGLMQLIPATARRFGVRNSFKLDENINGGVRYLRRLLDVFPDLRLALAAYNAGEETVRRYGGIPPYRETRNYVEMVGRKYSAAKLTLAAAEPPRPPLEESSRRVEYFVDELGTLHIRNR